MSSTRFAEIDAQHAAQLGTMSMHDRAVAGLPYLANDVGLARKRIEVRRLYRQYNLSVPGDDDADDEPDAARDAAPPSVMSAERRALLARIFQVPAAAASKLEVEPPFYCDYGYNIHFDGAFYCGWNTVILDCADVWIGDNVLFGPGVQVYSATHSVSVTEREGGWERALPVRFEHDVWVGGNATILAGVTVGAGSTIGAGAVVSKDVPPFSVVAGNPARVVRTLKPEERGRRWAQEQAAAQAQAQA